MANNSWLTLFPNTSLWSLPATTLELILDVIGDSYFCKRPFRFETMWTRDVKSSLVVKYTWFISYPISPTAVLSRKIAKTRNALSQWNKTQFGKLKSNIATVRQAILEIQEADCVHENSQIVSDLHRYLSKLLLREEIYW
ncbi:hypothetical protein TorRG33x02_315430 [Trema orientale]|uniref:Uncharacterized protein n=1 Tax=Trema orientale TaxID=63057 RepID=A0A2P5BN45_TREOI|nr:hypothetical protein TorRG33x02_315430 [Trema orientale]